MFILKWAVVAAFLFAYTEAFSETFVSLKAPQYSNKIVTSSTLRWITSEKGSRPETAVVGTVEKFVNESARVNPFKHGEESESDGVFERNVYICRASHSGIWIPGQLRLGRQACVISLHDNIYTYEKYEVLDNTDGGARLSWARWDRYSEVPVGAVSGGDTFVARKLAKQDNDKSLGMKHLIGKLDEKNGFGKLSVISEDEKEEEVDDGEVLIETEPVRYELTGIKFNQARKVVTKEQMVLGEVVLLNNLNVSGHIDTVISYHDNTTVYWGQVKAMLKGLKTIIRATHDSNILEEIEWGIPTRDFNERLKRVDAFLEPNTAVNVTLKGNHTEIETPYTARLIAVYSDGGNRARQIRGIKSEVQLQDVKPEYGPAYFTGNFSLVPTTTTTTTTTTSTTTKTTTQETTESSTNNAINKNINTNIINKDDGLDKINIMNHQDSQGKDNEKAASTQESNNSNQIYNSSFLIILFMLICRIL